MNHLQYRLWSLCADADSRNKSHENSVHCTTHFQSGADQESGLEAQDWNTSSFNSHLASQFAERRAVYQVPVLSRLLKDDNFRCWVLVIGLGSWRAQIIMDRGHEKIMGNCIRSTESLSLSPQPLSRPKKNVFELFCKFKPRQWQSIEIVVLGSRPRNSQRVIRVSHALTRATKQYYSELLVCFTVTYSLS